MGKASRVTKVTLQKGDGKTRPLGIGVCRARCWKYDWLLDVDIQRFFDTINHELMLKAVRHHSGERWVELYISRWLKSPIQHSDGTQELPTEGTPQGGVISPLLAALHPEKTKVVHCKDGNRKGWYPTKRFTFLGYTLQPRGHLCTGCFASLDEPYDGRLSRTVL